MANLSDFLKLNTGNTTGLGGIKPNPNFQNDPQFAPKPQALETSRMDEIMATDKANGGQTPSVNPLTLTKTQETSPNSSWLGKLGKLSIDTAKDFASSLVKEPSKITSPAFTAFQSVQKTIGDVLSGKIKEGLNTSTGQFVMNAVGKGTQDIPLRAVASTQAVAKTLGGVLLEGQRLQDALKNFSPEEIQSSVEGKKDWLKDKGTVGKFIDEVQNAGGQTAFGALLTLATGYLTRSPVAGNLMGGAYWSAVSGSGQLEERGEITSLTEIAIDAGLDSMLSHTLGKVFKEAKKGDKAFIAMAKGAWKGMNVEGGTEVVQQLLKYGDQYNKSDTDEQKQAVLKEAVSYIKSGALWDYLVGGTIGAILGGGAGMSGTELGDSAVNHISLRDKTGRVLDDEEKKDLASLISPKVMEALEGSQETDTLLANVTEQVAEDNNLSPEDATALVQAVVLDTIADISPETNPEISNAIQQDVQTLLQQGASPSEVSSLIVNNFNTSQEYAENQVTQALATLQQSVDNLQTTQPIVEETKVEEAELVTPKAEEALRETTVEEPPITPPESLKTKQGEPLEEYVEDVTILDENTKAGETKVQASIYNPQTNGWEMTQVVPTFVGNIAGRKVFLASTGAGSQGVYDYATGRLLQRGNYKNAQQAMVQAKNALMKQSNSKTDAELKEYLSKGKGQVVNKEKKTVPAKPAEKKTEKKETKKEEKKTEDKKDSKKESTDKTGFSGFTYKGKLGGKYKKEISEVKRIKEGEVTDDVADTAELTTLIIPEGNKPSTLTLNRIESDRIISKHGDYSVEDIVMTAKEFDDGVFIPKSESRKVDKVNLIKYTDDGFFLLGANRYNGYGVVTFFEKYPNNKSTENYLSNILEDGIKIENTTIEGDALDVADSRHSINSIDPSLEDEGAGNEPFQPRNKKSIPETTKKSSKAKYSQNLAPNGKPSKLTPEQYDLVRTKEFKDWFGDWENDPKNSSQVVDENGEPLVVYHGSEKAGFDVFDPKKIGTNTNAKGIHFTNSRSVAMTYSGSRDSFTSSITYEEAEWSIEERDGEYIVYDEEEYYREVFDTLEEAEKWANERLKEEASYKGIYGVFLNMRPPVADIDLRGGAWSDEILYSEKEGQFYTTDSYGNTGYEQGELPDDAELYAFNLNDLVLQSRDMEDTGLIVRNVYDDAGKMGSQFIAGESDQFIVFNSNQIKLADGTNTTFDSSNPSIRYSMEDYDNSPTLKTLEKIKDKDIVSKQFISDLTNAGDIKQAERDVIRQVLTEYEDGSKINIEEFTNKVKAQLIPLTVKTNTDYEGVSLKEEERGDVENYEVHVYESPLYTGTGYNHFSESEYPNYFGHVRVEDMYDGVRRLIEIQSDLMQKGRLEEAYEPLSEKAERTIKDLESQYEYIEIARSRGDTKITTSQGTYTLKQAKRNLDNEIQQYKDFLKSDFSSLTKGSKVMTPYGEGDVLFPTISEGTLRLMVRNVGVSKISHEFLPSEITIPEETKQGISRLKENIEKLKVYRNSFGERMIREEIKMAARKGITTLHIPTGKTAMKIEGLYSDIGIDENAEVGDIIEFQGEYWYVVVDTYDGKSIVRTDSVENSFSYQDWVSDEASQYTYAGEVRDYHFDDFYQANEIGIGKWLDTNKLSTAQREILEGYIEEGEELKEGIDRGELRTIIYDFYEWQFPDRESVLDYVEEHYYGEDIQYIPNNNNDFEIVGYNRDYVEEYSTSSGDDLDTDHTVYKFYEKDVRKFLAKMGAKPVEDSYGNEWMELEVNPEEAIKPVLAYSLVNQEKSENKITGQFLEDAKRRLGIEFDVQFFDTILAENGAKANGVLLPSNSIILSNASKWTTEPHEFLHLTLANLGKIQALSSFTRESILQDYVTSRKLTSKWDSIETEEAMAREFERYAVKNNPKTKWERFFNYLKRQWNAFKSVFSKSDGAIVRDYYDSLLFARSSYNEYVNLSKKNDLTRYIQDEGKTLNLQGYTIPEDIDNNQLLKFKEEKQKVSTKVQELEDAYNAVATIAQSQSEIVSLANEYGTTVPELSRKAHKEVADYAIALIELKKLQSEIKGVQGELIALYKQTQDVKTTARSLEAKIAQIETKIPQVPTLSGDVVAGSIEQFVANQPAQQPAPKSEEKTKPSRFMERMKKIMDGLGEEDVTYNPTTKIAETAKAETLYEQDKDRAIRIALGQEQAPSDILLSTIKLVVSQKAREEGNTMLWAKSLGEASRLLSRAGQEISMARNAFGENDPETFLLQLMEEKKKLASRKWYGEWKNTNIEEKVKEKTKQAKKKAENRTLKQRKEEALAREIDSWLDEITC